MVYASVIGGQSYDYMGYLGLMRDKQWGNSDNETATPEQMEKIAGRKDHPARLWLRAVLVDTSASFFMIVVSSAAFGILGTMILRPAHQIPEGLNLLTYQASFLTTLHPWLLPLYYLAVFLAFFGILYGGPELTFRAIYEYLRPLPWWRARLDATKLRKVWIGYVLGGGVILLWVSYLFPGADLVDLITPAGIYTGVLTCGFFGLVNPWVDRRFLPPALRMSWPLVAANIFSGILLVLMGLKALWDYDQIRAYVVLAALLLAAILLASRFAFFHQPPQPETALGAAAESQV
jgi:hypothetical protein